MKNWKYFILGPVIIAMAFTLPYWPLVILQFISGCLYFSYGFLQPKTK